MALDDQLLADCPYGPEGLLIDDVVEVDLDKSQVIARMPTGFDLPLTRTQRAHPTRHPAHLNGGLMVHMTGMVAYVHFFHVFGLRHADGWVGYGTRIYGARFLKLAPPGDPVLLRCTCTQARKGEQRILARYDFEFTQNGDPIYRSEQSALWFRTEDDQAR